MDNEMSAFQITDFPTEILEKIFWHFDDTTSAIATGVCKRFNEVINVTVRRKYNGSGSNRWYKMEVFDENESHQLVQHRPFIVKRVSAIELIFRAELKNRNHWIHRVMNSVGRNIQMIKLNTLIDDRIDLNFFSILSNTPNISHLYVDQRYRDVTHFQMRLPTLFDENELKSSIKNNGELKNVTLKIIDFRLLYAFDQTKIESLRCTFSHFSCKKMPVTIQPMQMVQLKSLQLQVPKNSVNECVRLIVAPCHNLQELELIHFDDTILTDETIDTLCTFRSLETFESCSFVSLKIIVRLIEKLPSLVSIAFWFKAFTIADCRVLLQAANRHPNLRYIHFKENMTDLYNHALLNWLMENVNERIQIDHPLWQKLVVTKGKVQYDGVTIMSLNESPIEYEKVTREWCRGIAFMASRNDQCYEFFSSLSLPKGNFDESERMDLRLCAETDEGSMKRKGTKITTAFTTFSSNYFRSVRCINWLEKYCHRLKELSIDIETNHAQLPTWTFPELNTLRINCERLDRILDTVFFTSLQCPQLNCLKFIGHHSISLLNLQVVQDINLFDNLVTLQMFHFNQSMDNLLARFTPKVRNSLRYLTLANRRIAGERYKMNNETVNTISTYPNLTELKLILAGLNETNTKFLFENCTKLSVLYIECNFISSQELRFLSYQSSRVFADICRDIQTNCISLKRLQLVWHDRMMEPNKVNGIKNIFPNVFIKIMQIGDHMNTTAEKIIHESDDRLEQLFDEFEV